MKGINSINGSTSMNKATNKVSKVNSFVPTNPRKYFLTAIAVQKTSFKEEYATQKLEQSCDALIRAGFCSGCRNCNTCALQMAHEETLTLLTVPSIREERYQAWVKKMKENNAHTGYGTRVEHYK